MLKLKISFMIFSNKIFYFLLKFWKKWHRLIELKNTSGDGNDVVVGEVTSILFIFFGLIIENHVLVLNLLVPVWQT